MNSTFLKGQKDKREKLLTYLPKKIRRKTTYLPAKEDNKAYILFERMWCSGLFQSSKSQACFHTDL